MFFLKEESQQMQAAVVIEQIVHCTCYSRPVSEWSLQALPDPRYVRFAGRANLSHRELAAPKEYVSSHSEVGSMAVSRKSKPLELFLMFTIRYKRCLSVSHSKSVFMYCIYSTLMTCSIATYVLMFLDMIYVIGRSCRTPFCDKAIKGRIKSYFCRYAFPAIFAENYCFNCLENVKSDYKAAAMNHHQFVFHAYRTVAFSSSWDGGTSIHPCVHTLSCFLKLIARLGFTSAVKKESSCCINVKFSSALLVMFCRLSVPSPRSSVPSPGFAACIVPGSTSDIRDQGSKICCNHDLMSYTWTVQGLFSSSARIGLASFSWPRLQ